MGTRISAATADNRRESTRAMKTASAEKPNKDRFI